MAVIPLLAMVRKDLELFFSDRRSVIVSFVVPIAIASFFGAVFSGGGQNREPARIAVSIVDQDDSAISKAIVSGAESDKNLKVSTPAIEEAREAVKKGNTAVAVVIPKGFGELSGQAFFGDGEARTPAALRILERLADVGLGYLRLGQPLPTLSGGERQRLKLATRMSEKGGVYVLDEPTTGLHLADVEQLLGLLDQIVDSGKSVIVIEHHQAVMAHADWIIDLGPGAGHDGGRVVFAGPPADLVAGRGTLTGQYLAAYVGA